MQIPAEELVGDSYEKVRPWGEIAVALLKKYTERYYTFRKREWELLDTKIVEVSPAPLNKGERQFVEDLKTFHDRQGRTLAPSYAGTLPICIILIVVRSVAISNGRCRPFHREPHVPRFHELPLTIDQGFQPRADQSLSIAAS